ncbi:hypothetical protein ANCDUO_25231, partial [Ancylostoma duodenale]
MVMFAKLAEDQTFSQKIRQFHALAPVATVSHIGGLFRIFGNYLMDFADFVLHRIPNSPLALPKILQKIMGFFCSLPLARGVCTLDIGFIDGSEKMFNNVVKSRKVEKFDYGEEGNMREYGVKTPPIYDLRNIQTPTFLYWSKDDILADTEDI